jgi:hypothetical protein
MDKVVNEGQQIPIRPDDSIQSSVVLDKVKLPIIRALRVDLDCLIHPVASASSRKASISVCSVRVIR